MRSWYKGAWWLFLLLPLEQLYRLLLKLRSYYLSLFKLPDIHVPIVVVGNIVLGGSGKTPAVIALASALTTKGLKVGIISRGYKGTATQQGIAVNSQTDFKLCGDECVLIARRTHCPVYACAKRNKAARQLIAEHNLDVIISDDGLQHHMPRAVEIAVVDAKSGFGNGHCLPVGPLREPLSRLKRVSFILINRVNITGEQDTHFNVQQLRKPTYKMALQLKSSHITNLNASQQVDLTTWRRQHPKVHAVAGIAHPQHFFNLLTNLKFDIIPHAFPDHHAFTQQELSFNDDLPILMTEKDAMRCQAYEDMNIWLLQLETQLDKKLVAALLNKLNAS